MSDVVNINMQSERPKVEGEHVHRCPVCYEAPSCRETCSIEMDLALDDGTLCGTHLTCEACRGGRYQEHAFAFLGRQATDEEVWALARFVEKLCKAAELRQRQHIAKMAVDAGLRKPPRFKKGDRVRVVKHHPYEGLCGVVLAVETSGDVRVLDDQGDTTPWDPGSLEPAATPSSGSAERCTGYADTIGRGSQVRCGRDAGHEGDHWPRTSSPDDEQWKRPGTTSVGADERRIEERLVVTDLCDLLAFEKSENAKRRLRRAINYVEGYDCFPGQSSSPFWENKSTPNGGTDG